MKKLFKKLIGNKGCRFWYCRRPIKGYLEIKINGEVTLFLLPYCEYHGEIAKEVADKMNSKSLTNNNK